MWINLCATLVPNLDQELTVARERLAKVRAEGGAGSTSAALLELRIAWLEFWEAVTK
jgi:hypothetical protein